MQLTAGKTNGEKFMTWVATGFGIGMVAPIAPGTLGSAPGVLLSLWTTRMPFPLQVLFCLGMVFLAVPFCGVAERVLMKKDDGRNQSTATTGKPALRQRSRRIPERRIKSGH